MSLVVVDDSNNDDRDDRFENGEYDKIVADCISFRREHIQQEHDDKCLSP